MTPVDHEEVRRYLQTMSRRIVVDLDYASGLESTVMRLLAENEALREDMDKRAVQLADFFVANNDLRDLNEALRAERPNIIAMVAESAVLRKENEALRKDNTELEGALQMARDAVQSAVDSENALKEENEALRKRKAKVCMGCRGAGVILQRDGKSHPCGACHKAGAVLVDG